MSSINDALARRRAESRALRGDPPEEPAAESSPPTPTPPSARVKSTSASRRVIAVALTAVSITLGVGVSGAYHCVRGSDVPSMPLVGRLVLVRKESWGFHDQFVDLDEIKHAWSAMDGASHVGLLRALYAAHWLGDEDLDRWRREDAATSTAGPVEYCHGDRAPGRDLQWICYPTLDDCKRGRKMPPPGHAVGTTCSEMPKMTE